MARPPTLTLKRAQSVKTGKTGKRIKGLEGPLILLPVLPVFEDVPADEIEWPARASIPVIDIQ